MRTINSKKKIKIILVGIGIIVLILIGKRLISNTSADQREQVGVAKAMTQIDKELVFPLKGSDGVQIASIKYHIENAELRDEILVKGQRATAVRGRTFFILNLKITNEHNQSIEINTKDYIRLVVNGNEQELFAPDIHNDPVEVQAVSTKVTRVGFPIDDNVRDLKLRVGEIDGIKEEIPVIF